MRILHISTFYGGGGAGIAAKRLHLGMRKRGIESKFLCLHNVDGGTEIEDGVYSFLPSRSIFSRMNRKFCSKLPAYQKQLERLDKNYEIFSLPWTDYDISKHPLVVEADIINLHWICSFVDYSFFNKVRKAIVWTLHDMNPFMGGFHYSFELNDCQQQLFELEKKIFYSKKKLLAQASNLNIVNLSKWMEGAFLESDIPYKHNELIPNGLDGDEFCYTRINSLNADSVRVLFVSIDLKNKRKGFDIILNMVPLLKETNNFEFYAIGVQSELSNANTDIQYLGRLYSVEELTYAYSMADVLLIPSYEDNLPNVMLESLFCGTPVISFNEGGMKDIIINGMNGYIINDRSSNALKNALLKFSQERNLFNREKIASFMRKNYSSELMCNRYLAFYSKITPMVKYFY